MSGFMQAPATVAARRIGPMSFALAASMMFAMPALAHVHVVETAPARSEVLAAPPGEVVVTFSDKVQPALSRISVTDSSGAAVDVENTATFGGDAAKLGVGLKPLAPGVYTVSWSAICIYNHKVTGKYTFEIKP